MLESLKEIFAKGLEFPEDILKAFESRQLVFFIGAGVSRIMGIPGWDDLSKNLIKKAFPTYNEQVAILRDVVDNKERITIAYKKFENENNLMEFYKIFGKAMQPNMATFNSKENIYEILNQFNAFFLTTNADNLFEDVLGSALCHEDYDPSMLKSKHQRKQNHLFYLHGHYTEDINPIVLGCVALRGAAGNAGNAPAVCEIMRKNPIKLTPVVTHHVPFEDCLDVFENEDKYRNTKIKIMIKFD